MPRKLPFLTPENESFWTGGQSGRLFVTRCTDCGTWFHPPTPFCKACGSLEVAAEPVSGRGTVVSFTINHQPWTAELREPYVVGIVELAEQPGVRFLTNIVNCPPERVEIGMPVSVVFLNEEDVWFPVFEPAVQ